MLMRITMPKVSANVSECSISKWIVGDGMQIEFGQDICELRTETKQKLEAGRKPRATQKQYSDGKADITSSNERAGIVLITASQPAYMVKVIALPGSVAQTGDLLAIAGTEEADVRLSPQTDPSALPDMRFIANFN